MRRLVRAANVFAASMFLVTSCSPFDDPHESSFPDVDETGPHNAQPTGEDTLEPVTYRDMVQQGSEQDTAAQVTDDDDTPPIKVRVDAEVVTAATCHFGELNLADALLAGQGNTAATLALALETNDGTLLASAVLDHAQLIDRVQQLYGGQTASFLQTLDIELSQKKIQTGTFHANLFVCVDTDGDGGCSDEQVAKIGTLEELAVAKGAPDSTAEQSRIMSAAAMVGSFQSGALTFARRNLTTSAADQAMAQTRAMLKSYEASEFGLESAPLQVTLAALTSPGCQYTVRTSGCFVEGTRISVGAGKSELVEKLTAGSRIMTANGQLRVSKRAVAGPELLPVLTVATHAGHTLTVTSQHPVMTDTGLKMASDLKMTDKVLTAKGDAVTIRAITSAPYSGTVYNFELPGAAVADHLVVAEGLVAGDLFLQEKLSAPRRIPVASNGK